MADQPPARLTELRIDTNGRDPKEVDRILLEASHSNIIALCIVIGNDEGFECFTDVEMWTVLLKRLRLLEHLRISRQGAMPGWGRGQRSHQVLTSLREGLQKAFSGSDSDSDSDQVSTTLLPRLTTLHLAPIAVQDLVSLRFTGGAVFSTSNETFNPNVWCRFKKLIIVMEDLDETWTNQHRSMASSVIRDYLRSYSLWLEQLEWTWLTVHSSFRGRNPLFFDDDINLGPGETPWIVWKELCTLTLSRTVVWVNEMERLFHARAGMLRKVSIRDNGMFEPTSTQTLYGLGLIRCWEDRGGSKTEVLQRRGPSWVTATYKEAKDYAGNWIVVPCAEVESDVKHQDVPGSSIIGPRESREYDETTGIVPRGYRNDGCPASQNHGARTFGSRLASGALFKGLFARK
ncbi:MAG: hypothetical protein M1814_002315 [Vezdaea aestivalis]|nr:MAG: hypothetical protein M1814_002315 [Vezdaea aestivalis]